MVKKILFLVFFAFAATVKSKPAIITNADTDLELNSSETLSLGNLEENHSASKSEDALTDATSNVHAFDNLPQTGALDKANPKLIRRWSYGSKVDHERKKRSNEDIKNLWKKKVITFFVPKYTKNLSRKFIRRSMQKALNMWGEKAGLKFKEVASEKKADIVVSSLRKRPSDGLVDTLFHVIRKQDSETGEIVQSKINFDFDNQYWKFNRNDKRGIDFFEVALQAVGYTLGLPYTDVKDTVMYRYQNSIPIDQLQDEDIRNVKSLYGKL